VLAQLEEATRRGTAPKQLWYLFVLEEWLRHERREPIEAAGSTARVTLSLANGVNDRGSSLPAVQEV